MYIYFLLPLPSNIFFNLGCSWNNNSTQTPNSFSSSFLRPCVCVLEAMVAAGQEARESSQVIKGKRTKRPRSVSPLQPQVSSSPAEAMIPEINNRVGDDTRNPIDCGPVLPFPGVVKKVTTEEEDMANCLILLSRAGRRPNTEACEVFRCKTCEKSFSSFQALGGHRTSHKKPRNGKIMDQESKDSGWRNEEHPEEFNTTLSLEMPTRVNNRLGKTHECSICGAGFSSGQALGGHMRRHRPIASNSTPAIGYQETMKAKNEILQLDLNLPAPEDEANHGGKFSLSAKEQVIVFNASPLVDCHY